MPHNPQHNVGVQLFKLRKYVAMYLSSVCHLILKMMKKKTKFLKEIPHLARCPVELKFLARARRISGQLNYITFSLIYFFHFCKKNSQMKITNLKYSLNF